MIYTVRVACIYLHDIIIEKKKKRSRLASLCLSFAGDTII